MDRHSLATVAALHLLVFEVAAMQSEGGRGLAKLPYERQRAEEGDGRLAYGRLDNGDGGDDGDDDLSRTEPGQREQAALVIQDAWRRRRLADFEPDESASELDVLDAARRATEPASQSATCCIVCFALVPLRSPVLKESNEHGEKGGDGDVYDDDAPLCADCVRRLAASDAHRKSIPGPSPVVNVPTRLTQLLRVEAKVNNQLKLLRDQHRVLLAQQEQLQATKRAQVEQAAAAKALARERRRHVRMLLERRKCEEELKFRQFVEPDQAEEGDCGSKTPIAAKKKSKTPARAPGPSSTIEKATGSPSDPSSAPLPRPITSPTGAAPAEKRSDKRLQSEIQEHTWQLWQRRKQTLDCYSQDLSPLVNGSKPKRLPVPAALLAIPPKHGAVKRALPNKQNGTSTTSPVIASTAHPSNQSMKQRRQKKIPSGGVKLRPLPTGGKGSGKSSADASNNQLDELGSVHYRSGKASPSPWSVSSPLTAEIKTVSWIYELGKDLNDDDPGRPAPCMSPAGLYSVMEDFEDDDHFNSVPSQSEYKHYAGLYGSNTVDAGTFASSAAPTPTSSATSLFPPLLRQLPPPVAVSSLSSTVTTSKTQTSTQLSGLWEYSTERLASLLEKYNVSVKEAVGPRG